MNENWVLGLSTFGTFALKDTVLTKMLQIYSHMLENKFFKTFLFKNILKIFYVN